MRIALQVLSVIALAGTILPATVFLGGALSLDTAKWIMLIAMIVWFATTPVWMDRKN